MMGSYWILLLIALSVFAADQEVACRMHMSSSHGHSLENVELVLTRDDGRQKIVKTDPQGNISAVLAAGSWTASASGFAGTKFTTSSCASEIVLLSLGLGLFHHDGSESLELEIERVPATKGQVFARLTHLVSGESQATRVKKALARFPGRHDGYYSLALFDDLGPVGQQILLVYDRDERRKASLEDVPFYIKRGDSQRSVNRK